MESIGIVDLGAYLPEKQLDVSAFDLSRDPMANSPLFRAPRQRHHTTKQQRASEMVELAARPMFARLGLNPSNSVDVVITNVLLPDELITGCGAEVAHRLGCNPEWIIDLHNGGCASFPYMLKIAQKLMDRQQARRALLCNVQNTAGTVFSQPELRHTSPSVVAGDGCGVAYVTCDGASPILGVETRHDTHCAQDMEVSTSCGRRYWEAGTGAVNVKFNPDRFKEIMVQGNALIPQVVRDLCRGIGLKVDDIDLLITNQPNRLFLRNWRNELQIPEERHFDTFDRFGNLYGAGAPVTLGHAVREGRLRDGDVVVLAGFAHAGDLAAAAAIHWNASAMKSRKTLTAPSHADGLSS